MTRYRRNEKVLRNSAEFHFPRTGSEFRTEDAERCPAAIVDRVVDAAYERRSVAVTSNLHPSGFDTIMPKALTTATVDRLLHHAHLVLAEGGSHRLSEAIAGKGVVPLA